MKLNEKAFKKLEQLNRDLIQKSFGEDCPDLGCSFEHSNEHNSGKAWDTLLDCNGDKATFPDNTALLQLSYDNERSECVVIDLSSIAIRNAANYYSALADVVEKLEKDTKQIPAIKPQPVVSSIHIDLSEIIKSNEETEFHMKLDIPGVTV